MKNVLTHLFYGNVSECDRKINDLANKEEYRKYYDSLEKFSATLSESQKKLWEEFLFCDGNYQNMINEQSFSNGVKLGMCLALELVDFNPSNDN